MDDERNELERLLRDRAAEVSHLQAAPPGMLARARRRVVRNAAVSAVAAGVVAVAVSVAFANVRSSTTDVPRSSTPIPPVAACTTADLHATAVLDGAAGSVEGSIRLTNHSGRTCTLEGRPILTIFSSADEEVPVDVQPDDAQWQVDTPASPPPGWPVVTLGPRDRAAVRVRWSNPCPELVNPARWTVELTTGPGSLDVLGAERTPPPNCLGPGGPSVLDVGPFEPVAGG
jgi:hypothetical protein